MEMRKRRDNKGGREREREVLFLVCVSFFDVEDALFDSLNLSQVSFSL